MAAQPRDPVVTKNQDTTGSVSRDDSDRLATLDMLRGAAGFAVLFSHARAYSLQSYTELKLAGIEIGLITKAFYAITSFGHEAVIIFFGLSGFLVGGKAARDLFLKRFSWPHYLLRRMTRLWIVLLPALAATFLFDALGIVINGGVGYGGQFAATYNSGPSGDGTFDTSLLAFLGNLTFLQTIVVPTYGTNSPLWSLANEFWYYIVFPLLGWVVLTQGAMAARLLGAAVLVVLILILPSSILWLGLIWLAGAIAGVISTNARLLPFLTRISVRILAISVLLGALGALGAAKVARRSIGDLEFGLIVACCLPILAHMPSPGGWYRRIARSTSEISYTLYLTHFPLLSLLTLP